MYLLCNNEIILERDAKIDLLNRAFTYGDGFFETIMIDFSKIVFFDQHFDRISNGLSVFGFEIPDYFDKDYLKGKILELLIKNGLETKSVRLKLIFYRSFGGLFVPTSNTFEILGIASERTMFKNANSSKGVEVYSEFPVSYTPISRFKNLNSAAYVFAGMYLRKNNFEDVLLLNDHLWISECLYSNIYWIKNGVLYTPSLESGCVEGVSRKVILNYLSKQKIKIQTGLFELYEFEDADFAFTSNVSGLERISKLGNVNFGLENKIYNELQKNLFSLS